MAKNMTPALEHGKWEVTLKDLRALKRKVAAIDAFTKDLDARLMSLAKAGVGMSPASDEERDVAAHQPEGEPAPDTPEPGDDRAAD